MRAPAGLSVSIVLALPIPARPQLIPPACIGDKEMGWVMTCEFKAASEPQHQDDQAIDPAHGHQ